MSETVEKQLIDLRTVAKMLSVSVRTVERMVASGHIPVPLRVGPRLLRWPYQVVVDWISMGCPSQGEAKNG